MSEQQSGAWIGEVNSAMVREPGPDADGPVLEINGEEGLVAMEIPDEAFVDALTHAAAEIQTVLDELERDRDE